MGLGSTRKIIASVLTVLLAIGTAALMACLAINTTIDNQTFIQKYFITDELVQACSEQLDAKYAVLESETGIPQRVFITVKDDYGVESSLKTALQNAFGAEDTGLYNSNMVNYFNNLCTEYLQDSDISFDETAVAAAADKAAKIYSETVGMHEIDSLSPKIRAVRNSVSTMLAATAFCVVLFAVLLFTLYTNKKKSAVYLLAGISAGGFGTAFGCLGCIVMKASSALMLSPPVYQAAAESLTKTFLLMTAAAALALCIAAYAAAVFFHKSAQKLSRSDSV